MRNFRKKEENFLKNSEKKFKLEKEILTLMFQKCKRFCKFFVSDSYLKEISHFFGWKIFIDFEIYKIWNKILQFFQSSSRLISFLLNLLPFSNRKGLQEGLELILEEWCFHA